MVAQVWGGERGIDWEFGVSRCKLLYIEGVSKSLLCSTEIYIQRPGINYSGKEYEKECTTPWTIPSETPLSMEFFQARILEWVAIYSSRDSSPPRNWTRVSCVSCIGRHVLYHGTTQQKLTHGREGNGTPLQYSCLQSPMDGGAWWAAVHGVTKSRPDRKSVV